MQKIILDNQLLLTLLKSEPEKMSRLLYLIESNSIALFFSKETLAGLLELLKTEVENAQLDKVLTVQFVQVLEKVISFQANLPQRDLGFGKNNIYAVLALAINVDMLVAQNYTDFKALDGFQKINVVEAETFWQNLDTVTL